MAIRVVVAGATGWAGRAIAEGVLAAPDMTLVAGVARRAAGLDLGQAYGREPLGVPVEGTVAEALCRGADVLVDYTHPTAVLEHVLTAIGAGVHVVIGTSGLGPEAYAQIAAEAERHRVGVIAAGNFSLTAALLKHFAEMAARWLSTWEIVEYADAGKVDAPSGTVRELAEALSRVRRPEAALGDQAFLGLPETRGASIEGTRVHAVRLPGFVLAVDVVFGRPDERLTLRHEAGTRPDPYVAGTLLAIRRARERVGLTRGLDALLFSAP